MQLHTLKRNHEQPRKRARVGRGGKRGTTSGRGTKGQRSRSGHRIRPAIRDLIQRLPKLRGVKNTSGFREVTTVNLSSLNSFKDSEVTLATLKKAKIVSRRTTKAKIVGNAKLTKKLNLKGVAVSGGAKKIIEQAGGTIA